MAEACGQEPQIDPRYLEYLEAKHFHDAALAARTEAEWEVARSDAVRQKLFARWQAAGGEKVAGRAGGSVPAENDMKPEIEKREKPAEGRRVKVTHKDQDHVLFYGHLDDIRAPWRGWTRVIPENGYIDLPPVFTVEGA